MDRIKSVDNAKSYYRNHERMRDMNTFVLTSTNYNTRITRRGEKSFTKASAISLEFLRINQPEDHFYHKSRGAGTRVCNGVAGGVGDVVGALIWCRARVRQVVRVAFRKLRVNQKHMLTATNSTAAFTVAHRIRAVTVDRTSVVYLPCNDVHTFILVPICPVSVQRSTSKPSLAIFPDWNDMYTSHATSGATSGIAHLARNQYSGADPGFLKGGGPGADTGFFTSTPPLDIVRVTSSALRKFEKHPHSWTSTSTPPPLDIARVTSSTFQGGRGDHPCHTHTPWIRH